MSREEDDAVALVRVYCGLASADPAEPQSGSDIWLTVAVVDDAGRLIDICEVSDDAGGYAELSALLAQRSGGTSAVAVAAESDDHVVTQLLTAAGRNLAFTDDDSADDYAERFADDESPEEIQSNAAERRAVGLARALQAGVLSAVGQSPPRDMLPLKPVLAAHAAVVSGRQSAAATLREVLRELYPAALRAYPDPAESIPLAILDALPEPGILGGGASGRKGDQAVVTELAKAGVADATTLGEAITALRVAIAETPRRTGVNRAMTVAVAETIRQSVAAVRAGDAAAAALVAVLADKMSPARRSLPNRQRPALTPATPLAAAGHAAPLNQAPAAPLAPATPLRPAAAADAMPSRSRAAAIASNARPAAAAAEPMPSRTRAASRAAAEAARAAEVAAAEAARTAEVARAGGRRRAQNAPTQALPPVVSAPPAVVGSTPAVVSGPPAVISTPPVVSTPPGYVPSAPPAYGSVPSAPPAYGSVPSAPPYGSVSSAPPAYGVPSAPPVTSTPPGYTPTSHSAAPPYQPAAYQAPTPMYAPAPPVPPTYQGQSPTPASMQSIPVPLQAAPPQPTPVAPLPVAPAPVAPPPVAPTPVIPPQPTSSTAEPQFTSLMPAPPPGIAPLIGTPEPHEMPRFDTYGFDPLNGMSAAPPITPSAPAAGGGRLSDLSALGQPPTLDKASASARPNWSLDSDNSPTTETSAAAYKFGADPLASPSELSSLPKLSDIPQPPDFSALDATLESTSGSLRANPLGTTPSSALSAFGSASSSGEFPPLNGERRSRAESAASTAASASAGLSRAERRAERDRADEAAAAQTRTGSRHADRMQDEEPARSERARTEIPRSDRARTEIPRSDRARTEIPRSDRGRTEIPRSERARSAERPVELPRQREGRVPPPWQTGELPLESAGLRLVEPAPVADPALKAGYPDELSGEYSGEFRYEPPALRLVDSERPAERATARSTGTGRSRRAQAADRDAAKPSSPDEGDGDLLIFAAARSAWFTDWDADTPAEGAGEAARPAVSWENSNDSAWQAAQRAAAPQIGDETSTGLPRRVPQQNLVPGAPVDENPERPLRIVRDAAQIAAHTTGYFRGWRRGQEVGGFSVGGRPGRESAGGWDFSREASRDYQEREFEYRSARR
ncbi:hypothetical protein Dvina_04735 [Dactylosporangium vinaceum]|uniref:Transposase n=1 Tax=Dactylosporangium vinaceum TaxID=53362 RepID=A0ABV5MI11_9ACTN|nr:hypothetical protein [Dactylosporangium vinaceum]UAB97479.1 hypothetical protein Dvina_04735 [Dactylosporangium vinaceum]